MFTKNKVYAIMLFENALFSCVAIGLKADAVGKSSRRYWMKKRKMIQWLSLVGSIIVIGMFQSTTVKAAEIFETNFSQEKGNWLDIKGTSKTSLSENQLVISNTTQGTSIESVSILQDAPLKKTGEVEISFLYEGQKNFGVIFRGSETDSATWQSFAYNGDGDWQLGQPGGKWITTIKGSPLVKGKTYRLLVRYEEKKIMAYLNGHLLYENQEVNYPNGNGSIDGDWQGKIGIRLFGDRVTLKVVALKNGEIGSIPLDPEESNDPTEAEAKELQQKWKTNLVGDFEKNPELLNDPDVIAYTQKLSEQANELYGKLNKESSRTYLWEKVASDTASADITTQFANLSVLARAYGTQGTALYQNQQIGTDIVEALDFMVDVRKYDGKKYHGNWWDWQIGVPQKFIDILMIMKDELTPDQLAKYTQVISRYVPDPYKQLYGKPQGTFVDLHFISNFQTTGANRTDLALTIMGLGILQKNGDKLSVSGESIKEVFALVTKGDGFYKDGSFIQHGDIPYTGSYGNVLVKGTSKILGILANSKWNLPKDVTDSFVTNVNNAFIPLIEKGEMMPMVNGRSISRATSTKTTGFGSPTMYNLLLVSEFADPSANSQLKESVKYWLKENPAYYYTNARDFKDLLLTKQVMSDETILGKEKPFLGSKLYGAMDRYVYARGDFSVGLSMYSNRISSFEAGNKENKRGWHTSDGMLYLFNQDQQYGEGYWPTIDPYRLPGTTVDTVKLADEVSSFTTVRSSEKQVGGATDGKNAAIGMALNKAGTKNNGTVLPMDLKAQKSWFVFDDQIVALGSGIQGTTSASIETVIENRMLDSNSTYQLLTNQGEVSSNGEQTMQANEWLLLSSSQKNQSIGYYFPQEETITLVKEQRTGKYSDINEGFPNSQVYTENYQKVLLNHGQKPIDEKYAYVLLPNATKQGLENYAKQNRIEILSNEKANQSVKDTVTGITAANLWAANQTVAGITFSHPASVLLQEESNKAKVTVANPLQTNEILTLNFSKAVKTVIHADENITISEDGRSAQVQTAGMTGGSSQLEVEWE